MVSTNHRRGHRAVTVSEGFLCKHGEWLGFNSGLLTAVELPFEAKERCLERKSSFCQAGTVKDLPSYLYHCNPSPVCYLPLEIFWGRFPVALSNLGECNHTRTQSSRSSGDLLYQYSYKQHYFNWSWDVFVPHTSANEGLRYLRYWSNKARKSRQHC